MNHAHWETPSKALQHICSSAPSRRMCSLYSNGSASMDTALMALMAIMAELNQLET